MPGSVDSVVVFVQSLALGSPTLFALLMVATLLPALVFRSMLWDQVPSGLRGLLYIAFTVPGALVMLLGVGAVWGASGLEDRASGYIDSHATELCEPLAARNLDTPAQAGRAVLSVIPETALPETPLAVHRKVNFAGLASEARERLGQRCLLQTRDPDFAMMAAGYDGARAGLYRSALAKGQLETLRQMMASKPKGHWLIPAELRGHWLLNS